MRRELAQVLAGENLSVEESQEVMDLIMSGEATSAQIGGYLAALRMKGETIEEITGAAQVMREKAASITTEQNQLVDVCGTGGDHLDTFNISTTTAFVVAGAGMPVAKHGNRSVSSQSGSADVLEALGVNLDLDPPQVGRCIDQIGIGFLYAPLFHKAMKHAIGPRKELGVRTIFNVLGPLTNPARANIQLVGVYDPKLTEPIAHVLKNLGVQSAFVVHGLVGLDELSTVGETKVSQLHEKTVINYRLHPNDVGLKKAAPEDLAGGSSEENARIMRDILAGKPGPKREIVLLNAAAALVAGGQAEDLTTGVKQAAQVIDRGLAQEKLNQLINTTHQRSH